MNKWERNVLAADRAFCALAQKTDSAGWAAYLDKHALMGTRLHEPYVEGRDKIVKLMEFVYALPKLTFTWEPTHAFVSDDGTLAVTSGTYERTYELNGETNREIGKYVTTWRNTGDEWKIIFDFGN